MEEPDRMRTVMAAPQESAPPSAAELELIFREHHAMVFRAAYWPGSIPKSLRCLPSDFSKEKRIPKSRGCSTPRPAPWPSPSPARATDWKKNIVPTWEASHDTHRKQAHRQHTAKGRTNVP